MAIALLLLFVVCAAGVGRQALLLVGAPMEHRLERWVVSIALGLGLLAYLVLALGLVGLLARVPVAIGIAVLSALCFRGFAAAGRDLGMGPRGERAAGRAGQGTNGGRALHWLAAAALLVLGATVLVSCFVPPSGHEWDALSYHLAAPKVYIENHRVLFLPTDHHSNFPFLVEMLFTLGLLYEGYALANLFHFAAAVLCVLGAVALGRRVWPGAGLGAAFVFATAPIVVWEAGAAYIEMGLTLYVLLAAAAAIAWRQGGSLRHLALAGTLMGFALSVKALALAPFALLLLVMAVGRAPLRGLLAYLVCAIVVGCPFYVKSAVWTGNPVYPYVYRVFGGRYWNQAMANAYSGEQRGFGMSRQWLSAGEDLRGIRPPYADPTVSDRLRNLLLAPFELVAVPRIYYNYLDPGMFTHLGFLFLALPPLLLLAGAASRGARWCAALALLWYVVWALTMQYVRYIIPLLPLLGLAGGEGLQRLARGRPWLGWVGGAAVGLQYLLALSYFGPRLFVTTMPRYGADGLTVSEYPGQLALAADVQAREEYLARGVNIYEAEQWLNRHTPPAAGVILWEDTRGFYLDRPYLWGNSPHSLYIPYGTFGTGRAMVDWFLAHGYRFGLLNLQYAPQAASGEQVARLWQAVAEGRAGDILMAWYTPDLAGDEAWRRLIGEALRSGAAVYRPDASSRAATVLEFMPAQPQPATGGSAT